MDEIDRYLEKKFKEEVEVPESFERTIRQALYSERFEQVCKRRKLIKKISIFCLILLCTSGCAIGGYIAYENVWKEPKQYTYAEMENIIANDTVTEEKKDKIIEAESIKNNVNDILNELGYDDQEIKKIEIKEYKQEGLEEVYYNIETSGDNENLNLRVNAENGNLLSLENNKILSKDVSEADVNKSDVEKLSNELFSKISQENDAYRLYSCNSEYTSYQGELKKVWVSRYYKYYNDVINPYEELAFTFMNSVDGLEISSIRNNISGVYENNPQVITEEEAIKIAESKEKELTDNEIVGINVSLGIRMSNSYIYELENTDNSENNRNYEESGNILLNSVDFARNVWLVEIEHELETSANLDDYLKSKDKIYYIDITTGEILGGARNYTK